MLVQKEILVQGEIQVKMEVPVIKDKREGQATTVKKESLGRKGRRVDPEPRLIILDRYR